jgi:hypothetical protein
MIEPIPFAGLVEIEESKPKYCSSCLAYKPAETGRMIQTASKNVMRFKCASCLNRTSARLYGSKKKK